MKPPTPSSRLIVSDPGTPRFHTNQPLQITTMCSCARLPHPAFKPVPAPPANPNPNPTFAHGPAPLRCALVARAAPRDGAPPSSFDFLALKRELEEEEEEEVVAVEAKEGGGGDGFVSEDDVEKEARRSGNSRRRTRRQMARRSGLLAKQVVSVSSARSLGFVSQLWVDTASVKLLSLLTRQHQSSNLSDLLARNLLELTSNSLSWFAAVLDKVTTGSACLCQTFPSSRPTLCHATATDEPALHHVGHYHISLHKDKWIVALVEVRPSLLSGEAEKFIFDDIYQVGDVVLVEDESVVENELKLFGLHSLVGYDVVTSRRRNVGKVRGFTFDINSGAMESLELDSFGLSILPAGLVSTYCLFVEDVLDIVSETIVVHEDAVSRVLRLTQGIWGTQTIKRPADQTGEYNRYGRRRAQPVKRQISRGKPMGRKLHRKTRNQEDECELPMDY